MQLKVSFLFASLVTVCSISAEESVDYFELSIEELMDLTVTTVSKSEEKLSDAPGVITVINQQQIKAFGARNLRDVLQRLPNYYMFDSSIFKASGTMLRAGATQHLNNHVLYLLNGHPLRDAQNGGLHTDINLMLSVDLIDRIEVVRGPGSVLYGSNAFNGTINIITKSAEAATTYAHVGTQIGSDNYEKHTLSYQTSINKEFELQFSTTVLRDGGAEYKWYDEQMTLDSINESREGESLYLNVAAYGLSFTTMLNEITMPAVSGANLWGNLLVFDISRELYGLSYKTQLNEDWSLAAQYTQNAVDRDFVRDSGAVKYKAKTSTWDVTATGKITDSLDLVVGGSSDELEGFLAFGGDYNTNRYSVYGQLSYQFDPQTKLIAGLQRNKVELSDAVNSPRIALIHNINDQWSTKVLYSEAFRSPYGSELFFDAPFLSGNKDLGSEIIKTLELQASYSTTDFHVNATLYQSQADHLVGRKRIDGLTKFINIQEKIDFTGAEFEWKWQYSENMRFQGNASHQTNENDSGVEDVMLAANNMVKIGISYDFDSALVLGLWNSYISAANKLESIPGSSPVIANPSASDANLMSINLNTNLGYLTGSPSLTSFKTSLFVTNLLDDEVWFPDLNRRSINTYPQPHQSGIFLNLSYEF